MLAPRFLGTSNVAFHRFGMGYRPPGPIQLARRKALWAPLADLLKRIGAKTPVGDNASGTMSLCGTPFDQGQTGSCTMNSTPKAVKVSLEGQGIAVASLTSGQADFSQRVGYANVRQLERGAAATAGVSLSALTDSGAMPDDCITVVSTIGMAPMSAPLEGRYSDIATSNVNTEATLGDEEKTVLATGAYDVDLTSSSRPSEWQAAINAKIGMTMAFFVDTALMTWDPSKGPITSINLNDPNGGGHQICGPVAWTTSASLGIIWTFLNSWGIGWGANGYLQITDKCLMTSIDSSIAYDIKVQAGAGKAAA
jgi:hypothetical protein